MTKLQISAEIDAPIEQVYEFFLDVDNWALPLPGSLHVKKHYVGSPKVEDTFDAIGEVSRRRWKARLKFTELVPNSKIVCEQAKGDMRSSKDTLVFEKTGSGTYVTETWEYRAPYSFLGQIFDAVKIRKEMGNHLAKRHSKFKEKLERLVA